jgi:hypothetical protein
MFDCSLNNLTTSSDPARNVTTEKQSSLFFTNDFTQEQNAKNWSLAPKNRKSIFFFLNLKSHQLFFSPVINVPEHNQFGDTQAQGNTTTNNNSKINTANSSTTHTGKRLQDVARRREHDQHWGSARHFQFFFFFFFFFFFLKKKFKRRAF